MQNASLPEYQIISIPMVPVVMDNDRLGASQGRFGNVFDLHLLVQGCCAAQMKWVRSSY